MEDILHRFNPWWERETEFPGIPRREMLADLIAWSSIPDVILISGLRRTGKTTLMKQMIHHLLAGVPRERVFYVSLDNLALRDHNILEIVDAYRRIHSLRHDDPVYLFLDEVHAKEDHEIQLKNLYDMGHSKIYASGSAALDMTMKGPHLTGRQRMLKVRPLSFGEYLEFTGRSISPADSHLYPALAEEYVLAGGLPEHARTGDVSYIQSLLDTIIYRDVAAAHGVSRPEALTDTLIFLASGVGAPVSLRKISRALGISKDEVGRYIEYFRNVNLIHMVERDGKLPERKASPRKIYFADTGFIPVLAGRVNIGCVVENAVYLTLAGRETVRYHRGFNREVDFITGDGAAFESKYMDEIDEKAIPALKEVGSPGRRTIITRNRSGEMDGGVVLQPLWDLLLERP